MKEIWITDIFVFSDEDCILFKCGQNVRNRSVLYSIYRYAMDWLMYIWYRFLFHEQETVTIEKG